MSSENKLYQAVLLAFLVLGILLGLSFAGWPDFSILGHSFKKVNLLADVEKKAPLHKSVPVKKAFDAAAADTCPKGMVCFEDYSPHHNALDNFWKALDSTEKRGSVCRIGFYGDSYIEGDIITADLRDTLQSVYGGRGVGFVALTTMAPGFRQTIGMTSGNFITYSIVGTQSSNVVLGPGEITCVPDSGNFVRFITPKGNPRLESFQKIRLYYSSGSPSRINYTIGGQSGTIAVAAGQTMQETSWNQDSAHSAKFSFGGAMKLYGAAFDDTIGIYVDNFSMRGNTGLGLQHANEGLFKSFDSLRHYDLLFLEYGLNVATANSKEFDYYEKGMIKSIERLKQVYPNTSIVLIGVGDRSTRQNGEFVTMESIPLLIESQRRIAQKTGIAFWDLFEAMGGENSMPGFVNHIPPLANKDYTHLTFEGGRTIGRLLAATLFYEHKKHKILSCNSRP